MHWLRVAYKADTKPVINTILEKYHLEAALMTKPGDTLGMVSTTLVHEMAKALLLLVADNMRRTMPTKGDCSPPCRARLPTSQAATVCSTDLRWPPWTETTSPAAFSSSIPFCRMLSAALISRSCSAWGRH